MRNVNPSQTEAWQKLKAHFEEIKTKHLRDWFAEDADRLLSYTSSGMICCLTFRKIGWIKKP